MKRFFALLFLAVIAASLARAETPKIEAVTAKDEDSKPTDTFAADVPKIYAFFRSTGTKKGDILRSVWVADDVGEAAPKSTKIDEATLTADKDDFFGAFSLSKPTKGWPLGQYHVDIYSGDQLATSVKFTVKAGKNSDDADDDDDDKDDTKSD